MNEFQERLQSLLIEKNLNRLQLAKAIKVSSTTINGYFNKNYYPQIDIAIKIANYFNCSLDYLFGFSDDEDITNTNSKYFIENFDALLKEKNLKINQTMKDLKMSEYDYYRWKKGLFPKTVNLIEIVKYFDTSLNYLVGNKHKPFKKGK